MVGQVLDKRYLLVQKIGSGGMGSVFLGLQKPFNRKVAIKVISSVHVTENLKARFEREARALSELDHPNIVRLLDYGIQYVPPIEESLPFMVLEYVEQGVELDRFFKELHDTNRTVSRTTLLHIFSQVLDALATAHAKGLIHRDIKPGNIMLKKVQGNPFFVKVLDFGLAKAVSNTSDNISDSSLTNGMIIGTPQYMAPEQGNFKKPVDQRADLYAVGSILFEAICGVKPFQGNNAMDLLLKKNDPQYDPFLLPQAKILPGPVREFLKKAIATNPEDRFPDAQTFKDALQQALMAQNIRIKGLEISIPEDTTSTSRVYDSKALSAAADSDAILGTLNNDEPAITPKKRSGLWAISAIITILIAAAFFGWSISGNKQDIPHFPSPHLRMESGKMHVASRRGAVILKTKPDDTRKETTKKAKRRKKTHSKPRKKTDGWQFLP